MLVALTTTSQASAYCADTNRVNHWGAAIPVYVSTSGPRDVSTIGHSDETVVAAVVSVIEMFNHGAADIPLMYFAGEVNVEPNDIETIEPGAITVVGEGAVCDLCTAIQPACWRVSGTRHYIAIRRPYQKGYPKACESGRQLYIDNATLHDLTNTLLHEFGHAVGLHHTSGGCNHTQSEDTTYGVMNKFGVIGAAGRRLRLDDILGLGKIYGYRSKPVGERVSLDGGATWSAATEINPWLLTWAPVTGSSASMQSQVPLRAIAFSEFATGRPGVLTGGWNGWDSNVVWETVDGAQLHDGVAVAVGRDSSDQPKVIAAWYAEESLNTGEGELRWSFKTYTGAYGGWNRRDGPSQESKILALGYDDEARNFVLSTLDYAHHIVLYAISADDGFIEATTYFDLIEGDYVRDTVGSLVCYRDGINPRCVLPYTVLTPQGTCMGWYELTTNPDGSYSIVDSEENCNSPSYGPNLYFAG